MEFSDIALAKLLQTAPDLGSLILTFQDVTDQVGEGEGVKVGVFVLQSGAELMYVPVVSKGDSVYPIDSIFLDSKKKFLPLTRKVIDSAVAAGQIEPGKGVKIPKGVTHNPSVYNLINPPRTGKHVYASTSRLVDFLASLPQHVKQATFEQISGERSLYDNLDKMFSLKAIFDVLKAAPQSAAASTPAEPISVATQPTAGMSQEAVSNILNKGYHITGKQAGTRVAVSMQDFAKSKVRQINHMDADTDYEVAFADGNTREAFLPRMHGRNGSTTALALFTNGDYATRSTYIAVGEPLVRKKVLDRLFNYRPPVLLRDVVVGDKFVIMTVDGEFIGPVEARQVVLNSLGVEIATSGEGCNVTKICGYRNFSGTADSVGSTLYVPSSAIVVKLGMNVGCDIEVSANNTQRRQEFSTAKYLGSEMNLGFDGVEFSANGKPVGGVPQIMRMLVVSEGVEPSAAESFVKQAQETKFVKIYMSKQASTTDYAPAEIPNYGIAAADQKELGMNGAFVDHVQQASQVGDSQVVEATVISELLQVPSMFEQIDEYMPDIEEAVDKLGRILFMSRVHINRLAEVIDSDSVFSMLAQLKTVYRLLGDNMLRLQQITNSARAMPSEVR